MVSALILGLSAFALVRFALYQWRAIWISAANQSVSDSLRAATGIDAEAVDAQDFATLVAAHDRFFRGRKSSTPWLREIRRYYRFLASLERASRNALPSVSGWAVKEMKTCSRYVAVAIDQHLSVDLDRRAAARAS